jgi:hypothetical protein
MSDSSANRQYYTYEVVKFISRHLLPVIGTLFFIVAMLGDWSDSLYVLGIILTLQLILGIFLSIMADGWGSDLKRYTGDLVVYENSNGDKGFRAELESRASLRDLDTQTEAVFRVRHIFQE